MDDSRTGISTLGQCGPESNGNEGVLHILKPPGLEPHHQMQFSVITMTWFQVLLSNTNNSIQHYTFICMQLNIFQCSYCLTNS